MNSTPFNTNGQSRTVPSTGRIRVYRSNQVEVINCLYGLYDILLDPKTNRRYAITQTPETEKDWKTDTRYYRFVEVFPDNTFSNTNYIDEQKRFEAHPFEVLSTPAQ